MPVTKDGVGYSQHTFNKEDDFAYLAKLVAGKVKGLELVHHKRLPFHYIDTHAGCGHNTDLECEGSPVVVTMAISSAGIHSYKATLIDLNENNCSRLRAMYESDNRISIKHGDCREVLKELLSQLNGYGLLLVDPNGDPYWDMIRMFFDSDATSKIDLCIRLGATNWKRTVSVHKREDLFDSIASINKEYWYLKRPIPGDGFQWTTLFATNNPRLVPARRNGFINIKTEEGQCFLNILNHCKATLPKEYKASQLPIWAFRNGRRSQ